MQHMIVKLMSKPTNGWMAICLRSSRFSGIAGKKC
jgi:hypothetical protein